MKKSALTLLGVFSCLASAQPEDPALPADATVEVAFSPKGQGQALIIKAIQSATVSIRVAAYSFTSKPIAEALRDAHQHGIDVRIVADSKGNTNQYTAVTYLANQGVPVRLNDKYAIMHNKYIIIDGRHVESGSFNYTASAQNKNAENVLLLWNVPELAEKYTRNWEKLWNEGVDVGKRY